MAQDGGVSRRRLILGAAWTAPAIVIATAAPARAASLPQGQGVVLGWVSAWYQSYHWVPNLSAGVQASVVQANFNNVVSGPAGPLDITELTAVFIVPTGSLDGVGVVWGLGSPGITGPTGVQPGTPFTLASSSIGTGESAGTATLTFTSTGFVLTPGANYQLVLWVQATSVQTGNPATATLFAKHRNGDTSSSSMTAIAALMAPDPEGGSTP